MEKTMNTRQTLSRIAHERRACILPGAFNALSARTIEDLGFEAIYLTGAGFTNMQMGLPDLAFMGLTDLAQHTAVIREAVALPLVVDADTGFGNALNTYRAVRVLERAGADCIQLEDQVSPKRCGHFDGKEVVSSEEMCGKIKAACDARRHDDTLILARTDAFATHGYEVAAERALAYQEAGADLLFVEAVTSHDDIRALTEVTTVPQIMNMVIGGKTPLTEASALAAYGYGFSLYANAALQGALLGMQRALGELLKAGVLQEDPNLVSSFSDRQRLVDKEAWDHAAQRY